MGWFRFVFRAITGSGKSDDVGGNTYRQDRYEGSDNSKNHDHTWSKTTSGGGGEHREGWVGSNFDRGGDSKK